MKNKVRKMVHNVWSAFNSKAITEQEYCDQIDKICTEYGTEYVAQIFVGMTKAGEQRRG